MNRYRLCGLVRIWSVIMALGCYPILSPSELYAQVANPLATQAEKPKSIVVIQLRYIDAETAVRTIKSLASAQMDSAESPELFTLVAESRTNSLFISAGDSQLKVVRDLIKMIDVPAKDASMESTELETSMGSLFSHDDPFLHHAAKLFGVQVAVQPELELVLMKGEKEKVEALRAMLRSTQAIVANAKAEKRKSARAQGAPMVRIIWLTSQKSISGEPKRPSQDLDSVLSKLKEIGIADLGVACQLVARIDTSEFEVSGMTKLAEVGLTTLKVKAHPVEGDSESLTFSIEGSSQEMKPLFELKVGARLLLNKTIVLASSPFGETQSVFVVQLVDGF